MRILFMSEVTDEHRLFANWAHRLHRTTSAALQERVHHGPLLPEPVFPLDRSWMVTTLWDDSRRSIGVDAARAGVVAVAIPAFEQISPDVDISTTGRRLG